MVKLWTSDGITIGPEPKPIRTDDTIHFMCATEGHHATFKLQCRECMEVRMMRGSHEAHRSG